MTNRELDELLQKARAPELSKEYQADFPKSVTRALHSRPATVSKESRPKQNFIFWAIGFAAACIALGFFVGVRFGKQTSPEESLAAVQKYFREIEEMFPNQVRAIVFENGTPRLVLSEKADVPDSSPLFLKVCGGQSCQQVVTFSGQQIQINSESFEVLSGSRGEIILVGNNSVWSSAEPNRTKMKIEARTLEL